MNKLNMEFLRWGINVRKLIGEIFSIDLYLL